jgi:hypothetical protein
MLIITTNFPKGFFLTFLGFGRFIIMIYLFVLRASLLDYGIVGKILDSSRDLSRYSDSYTFWCVMLWRGSRSTAYIVDCAQIGSDLSIVPFWGQLLSEWLKQSNRCRNNTRVIREIR